MKRKPSKNPYVSSTSGRAIPTIPARGSGTTAWSTRQTPAAFLASRSPRLSTRRSRTRASAFSECDRHRAMLNVEIANGVARVTLNRPELRNAFDDALIRELQKAFENLQRDAAVRVVVLAGNGPAFCAG